jgi:hypothetical protein
MRRIVSEVKKFLHRCVQRVSKPKNKPKNINKPKNEKKYFLRKKIKF